jgi:hypothetical protein
MPGRSMPLDSENSATGESHVDQAGPATSSGPDQPTQTAVAWSGGTGAQGDEGIWAGSFAFKPNPTYPPPTFSKRAAETEGRRGATWGRVRSSEVRWIKDETKDLLTRGRGVRPREDIVERYGRVVREEVDHRRRDGRVVKVSIRRSARLRGLITAS